MGSICTVGWCLYPERHLVVEAHLVTPEQPWCEVVFDEMLFLPLRLLSGLAPTLVTSSWPEKKKRNKNKKKMFLEKNPKVGSERDMIAKRKAAKKYCMCKSIKTYII